MKISFILLISLLLIGCNQSNNQDASSSMELATNGNSSITADDFNEYLLSLTVQQRWP